MQNQSPAQQRSPERIQKQPTGEERRNEFMYYFYEQKLWELTELKREDIHFGVMDLYTLKEKALEDMNNEIQSQIKQHQVHNQKQLPEYRLQGSLPKWLPKILGVKTLNIENQDLLQNVMAQIDLNLQHFFQYNPEVSKVFAFNMNGNEISIFFEYHEFSLEEDIITRQQENRPFQEHLLWKMLFSLIRASSLMNRTNQTLTDIRPSRTYYNKYQLSVVPYGIFPDQDVSIIEKCLQGGHGVFFAPEQFAEFQQGRSNPDKNFFDNNFKVEAYQIGMTILMAGLMISDSNPAYDYKERQLRSAEVSNMLMEFGKRYSSTQQERLLAYTLERLLLNKDPQARVNPQDLFKVLEPLSRHILFQTDMKDFKHHLSEAYSDRFPGYKYYLDTIIQTEKFTSNHHQH